MGPALGAAGVAPEVALGLMRQMTGAKVMPVVGGRCCQEVPLQRGILQGRLESVDLFVLVALLLPWVHLSKDGMTRNSAWTWAAILWRHGQMRMIYSREPGLPGS